MQGGVNRKVSDVSSICRFAAQMVGEFSKSRPCERAGGGHSDYKSNRNADEADAAMKVIVECRPGGDRAIVIEK